MAHKTCDEGSVAFRRRRNRRSPCDRSRHGAVASRPPMRRAFKSRIYPTQSQAKVLDLLLDGARARHNAALEQRRTTWCGRRQSIPYEFQAAGLKEAPGADPRLILLNYSACQGVLRRLHKAFDAFFRRVNNGKTPGDPRFISRHSRTRHASEAGYPAFELRNRASDGRPRWGTPLTAARS